MPREPRETLQAIRDASIAATPGGWGTMSPTSKNPHVHRVIATDTSLRIIAQCSDGPRDNTGPATPNQANAMFIAQANPHHVGILEMLVSSMPEATFEQKWREAEVQVLIRTISHNPHHKPAQDHLRHLIDEYEYENVEYAQALLEWLGVQGKLLNTLEQIPWWEEESARAEQLKRDNPTDPAYTSSAARTAGTLEDYRQDIARLSKEAEALQATW